MALSTTELQRLWVISYDVAHPRRLRRIAQQLELHAVRVQKSVFEAQLDWGQRQRVAATLIPLLNAGEDSLLWHPLCRRCQRGVITLGNHDRTLARAYWIV